MYRWRSIFLLVVLVTFTTNYSIAKSIPTQIASTTTITTTTITTTTPPTTTPATTTPPPPTTTPATTIGTTEAENKSTIIAKIIASTKITLTTDLATSTTEQSVYTTHDTTSSIIETTKQQPTTKKLKLRLQQLTTSKSLTTFTPTSKKMKLLNKLKTSTSTESNKIRITPQNIFTTDMIPQTKIPGVNKVEVVSEDKVLTDKDLYQERIEALDCKILPLPIKTRIWRGNQTHELNLPKQKSNNCIGPSCEEWEGDRDMQSGDVLLVRIDDAKLIKDKSKDNRATVYQVTRGGRDSCDVTEGVLLDISPLQSEGKTLVALYDRDLTEGANLLIIVSDAWGSQCVRLSVTIKSENCGDDQDCSGKGLCFSNDSMESYECQCCSGFIGPHCEEKDACYPSPCQNNGICVDISQGHDGNTFQCLCPYGFTGKTCEDNSDPCESGPCQNGGSCSSSNLTAQQFKCLCPPGFSGTLCQHNLDACASSPCGHGMCVDQAVGYRCFCQPGFSGEQCQFEYNECESSPCLNGGSCSDHIGRFSCACGHGYTGQRCHIKIDLCDPNPCSHHHYCVDKGNTFSCECPKGFQGADCDIPAKVSCSHNPCLNGGTCWSSIESFYCSCPPSFTGQICNVELLMDDLSSDVEMPSDADRNSLDLQMPITIHLDHLHSIYVAAGTLACALLIVIITVTICHCKMHGTHKKIYIFLCRRKSSEDKKPTGILNRNRFIPPVDTKPVRKMYPCFDSSEMYYGLDFSDSQSSPLIQ